MKFYKIIDRRSNRVFAVLTASNGMFQATGVDGGKEWASWVSSRDLDFEQIVDTLDPSLKIDGPFSANADILDVIKENREIKSVHQNAYYYWANNAALSSIGEKAIGRTIRNSARRAGRSVEGYDPNAVNADGDPFVQDGTPWERPDPNLSPAGAVTRNIDRIERAAREMERRAGSRRRGRQDRRGNFLSRLGRAIMPSDEQGQPQEETATEPRTGFLRRLARRAAEIIEPDDKPGSRTTRRRRGSSSQQRGTGKVRDTVPGLLKRLPRTGKKELGKRNKAGFHVAERVEVGNKGMSSLDDAVKHLKDGGDLLDVPDDFLADAIFAQVDWDPAIPDTGRFKMTKTDGGRFILDAAHMRKQRSVNGIIMVTDSNTGQRFGIKYSQGAYGVDEDVNEILGLHLAERLGFAQGGVRFAGVERGSNERGRELGDRPMRPVLIELAQDVVGEGTGFDDGWGIPYEELTDNELMGWALLDYLMQNRDRHGDNFFTIYDDEGRPHFYPIDHGLGFDGYNLEQGESPQGSAAGLKDYMAGGSARMRPKNKTPQELKRRGKDNIGYQKLVDAVVLFQAKLKEAEDDYSIWDAMEELLSQTSRGDEISLSLDLTPDRLEYIMSADPTEIVNILVGRAG